MRVLLLVLGVVELVGFISRWVWQKVGCTRMWQGRSLPKLCRWGRRLQERHKIPVVVELLSQGPGA